jgi:hypothetical protein
MTVYEFDQESLKIKTKPMTRSVTVWGGVIASFPVIWNGVLENLPQISESIDVVIAAGVLNPKTTAVLSLIGGLLAIYGRVRATKEIEGL